MANLENINSANEPPLEQEIQLAVSAAIEPLLATNGWRMYTGPMQTRLGEELATLLGTAHIGLACSGSAALEIVLRACHFSPGDEVLLSAYDYPGNFGAIENAGLRPVLVDTMPNSWNLSTESLLETCTPACKALIVSHLHGQLQDMADLQALCHERGLVLIQDACQSLGANILDQKLGAWADATFVSFGGSKTLSAGRGGAWCIDDARLAQHARIASGAGSGAYELSEIQAAMVLAQLPFLDRITHRCREYFNEVATELSSACPGLLVPWQSQWQNTAFYQAGFLLPPEGQAGRVNLNFGHGFDGFHRRSQRRCRIAGQLANCSDIVGRTVTLHHRLALQTGHA